MNTQIDRRNIEQVFRTRLQQAFDQTKQSRAEFSRRAGINRSTLSQLLNSEQGRLPRAETIAAIASVLQVSVDWLLGLSAENLRNADILNQSLQITNQPRSPIHKDIAQWHLESVGQKNRYVPQNLPDLVKTKAVLEYEYADVNLSADPSSPKGSPANDRVADTMIAVAQERLQFSRLPTTEMEICMSMQYLESFVKGEGVWADLSSQAREEQVKYMIRIFKELYPSVRLYCFDLKTSFSIPYTVFGHNKAAVFFGQFYFVFNTHEHIQILIRHFDDLIRATKVHAHEVSDYIQGLADKHL